MENNTYNGWTNYATWRINLEYDLSQYCYNMGIDLENYTNDNVENITEDAKFDIINNIKDQLESYVTESLEIDCNNNTTLSYALAFIDDVNWYEIANHAYDNLIEDL